MKLRLLAALAAMVLGTGCSPLAAEGESCARAPCVAGLACVEGLCAPAPIPDAGPSRCETSADCVLGASADGRVCEDGVCAWASCGLDLQCGTRICDRGVCALFEPCFNDEGCAEDQVCEGSACRGACEGDGECGSALQGCADDGRCRQRCLGDFLCFGALCEGGLCRDPQCALDEDCAGEGTLFCNQGRCESFVPCAADPDCFSADFRCNALGRCEERATCRLDDECGLEGVCLRGYCRPTSSCLADAAACSAGQECLAGRCVAAPSCRQNADCGALEVCLRGECWAESLAAPASLVVQTSHGLCHSSGEGACRLVLFPGEGAHLGVGAFDDDDAPVSAAWALELDGGVTAVALHRAAALLLAAAPGAASSSTATLTLRHEAVVLHEALAITVLPAAAAPGLRVLVIDEASGAPLQGALVAAGGETASTDADGLALFAALAEPLWISARHEGRGLAVEGLAGEGDLRLPLPSLPTAETGVAGFSARVVSSGSETGPVGTGLVLPSLRRLSEASLGALFGPSYAGSLAVPFLGDVTLALPAAATLEATVPFGGGNQEVRGRAFTTTAAGRRGLSAFERRSEIGELFALFGADPTELALDLAATAEGMRAQLEPAGILEALPHVPDENDIDGDGDLAELVPDYGALPAFEVSPARLPAERLGVLLGPPPSGARSRPFLVVGLAPAGYGFVPVGMGAPALDEASTPRQIKALAPHSDALSWAPRALVAEAVFDDTRQSRIQRRFAAFPTALDLGPFLAPPTGYFFLDGMPAPGTRSLVLPEAEGATTWRVTLSGSGTAWTLVVTAPAGGGRTLTLPSSVVAASLSRVESLRLPGASAEEATHASFLAGAGPAAPLEERAEALASSP
jgi:hypothetical protein